MRANENRDRVFLLSDYCVGRNRVALSETVATKVVSLHTFTLSMHMSVYNNKV